MTGQERQERLERLEGGQDGYQTAHPASHPAHPGHPASHPARPARPAHPAHPALILAAALLTAAWVFLAVPPEPTPRFYGGVAVLVTWLVTRRIVARVAAEWYARRTQGPELSE